MTVSLLTDFSLRVTIVRGTSSSKYWMQSQHIASNTWINPDRNYFQNLRSGTGRHLWVKSVSVKKAQWSILMRDSIDFKLLFSKMIPPPLLSIMPS